MLRLTSSTQWMSLFDRKRQLLHFLDLSCRPIWKLRYRSAEFERLLAAVHGEASRRIKSEPTSGRAHGPRPQKANPPAGIPSGKANAVRAAFKAGVKPSAIARQFGLSQADIRALLNSIDRR